MNGGKCREEGSSKSEEERGTEAVSRGNIFFFFFFFRRPRCIDGNGGNHGEIAIIDQGPLR